MYKSVSADKILSQESKMLIVFGINLLNGNAVCVVRVCDVVGGVCVCDKIGSKIIKIYLVIVNKIQLILFKRGSYFRE